MKYAVLDDNGFVAAFYSDDVHPTIPENAIEISDEQWLEYINNNGKRKFENGLIVEHIYILSEEDLIMQGVQNMKIFLSSTDYKMTVDYFATMTEEDQLYLTNKRADARDYILKNELSKSKMDQ